MTLIIENLMDELCIEPFPEDNNVTEHQYMEMAEDFKDRMILKNTKIQTLQKKIICIYALIERYMEVDDPAFLEEARDILDKVLVNEIGIQDID